MKKSLGLKCFILSGPDPKKPAGSTLANSAGQADAGIVPRKFRLLCQPVVTQVTRARQYMHGCWFHFLCTYNRQKSSIFRDNEPDSSMRSTTCNKDTKDVMPQINPTLFWSFYAVISLIESNANTNLLKLESSKCSLELLTWYPFRVLFL